MRRIGADGGYISMKRTFKHLTLQDRKFIEKMRKQGVPVSVIADTLGVSRSTIYRELKRGAYMHTVKHFDVEMYSCDKGQTVYDNNRQNSHRQHKIRGKELQQIEIMLLNKYSPEMAVKACNIDVSIKTIYNYIDNCRFKKYRNIDLIHGKRPRRKQQNRTHKQKHNKSNSIEFRSDEIMSRDTFGHWEMDTVIGKKSNDKCLLVMSERKTRKQIIAEMEDKTTKSVVRQLRALQRYFGADYSKIFKTITVDNGSEFADIQSMKRFSSTQFYYCHPYSSWERGTNENRNKLIRRFIPKKTAIKEYSTDYIKSVEHFINNYPMRIHNYQNPDTLFNKELENLGISTKCRI